MKNNINLEQFNKLKLAAREAYEKIGGIYCPALKADIIFNSDGFHHLRYDSNRSEREKLAQANKFKYFNDSVEILKKATTIQEYRRSIIPVGDIDKNGFHKTKTVEWFGFFAIVNFSNCIRIKAVVRRVGEDGKYHFWSVMPFWTLSDNKRVVGSKKIEDC
ncbi:MAG: hypothetical protein PHW53_04080 [Patescibacteria group bacterium]|nr:hypothetical protein [Patescibacteria group bacterium]